jgi:hypothetical protein
MNSAVIAIGKRFQNRINVLENEHRLFGNLQAVARALKCGTLHPTR